MKKKLIITSIIIFLIFLSIFIYARFIGTNGLKVKEYKIASNIKENFHGLKIVHFTDLHYGTTINKKELEKIVDKINFIKPDIVVFTGDLTEKYDEENINNLTSTLSKINALFGKYAVSGNHDINNYNKIIEKSGFKLLNNTYELIYKDDYSPILLSGISSNILDKTNISEKLKTTYEYLENNIPAYTILLTHEPDIIDETNNFDLVLSGHSHNYQINIPLIDKIYKLEGAVKYHKPHYKINNTDLYISGGLGTSKIKLRLFNKPSFNFYRITKS